MARAKSPGPRMSAARGKNWTHPKAVSYHVWRVGAQGQRDAWGMLMRLQYPVSPLVTIALLLVASGAGCRSERSNLVSGREITVEMTGADYRWRTRHAGFDGSLDTPDDIIGGGNLVVPAGRTVHLLLRSDDFVYTFYVPDLNVNQIAVPSLTFDARFVCDSPGEIAYIADQMCGFLHETLLGDVTVISESDYADWLRNGKASRAQANTGSKSAGRVGT